MRKYIFWRASKILKENRVKKVFENKDRMSFEVTTENDTHHVTMSYEKRKGKNSVFRFRCGCMNGKEVEIPEEVITKWGCSCDFMGKQGVANNTICSHILACFGYMILNFMNS